MDLHGAGNGEVARIINTLNDDFPVLLQKDTNALGAEHNRLPL